MASTWLGKIIAESHRARPQVAARTLFFSGKLYLSQLKYPEAVSELRKEMEINPGYAAPYYQTCGCGNAA